MTVVLSVSVKSELGSLEPLMNTSTYPVVYGFDVVNVSDPPAPTVYESFSIEVSKPPPAPPPSK